MRKILIFLSALAIFLFLPAKVIAVTIEINSLPSSISSDPFNIGVSITGPSPGTNYLRIDLYKEGTTNYFGETFNGTSWYGGSEGNQYFPVVISSEGTASATLQGRVGNPSSSDYPGSGSFKLRIRRYTSSGNPASGDQQTPVDVQITILISTPTPTPEPTATPPPGNTQTPTPTPTSKPLPTPTKKPTLTPTLEPTPAPADESAVAPTEEVTPTISPEVLGESRFDIPSLLPKFFIGGGLLLLLGAGGALLLPKLKQYRYNRQHGKDSNAV